jgi:hypothetical protein
MSDADVDSLAQGFAMALDDVLELAASPVPSR